MTGSRFDLQDDSFIPLGITQKELNWLSRDQVDLGFRTFTGQGGFRALIPNLVIDQLFNEARAASPNEALWRVASRVYRDDVGLHVVVVGVVRDANAHAGPTHVEATPESAGASRALLHQVFGQDCDGGWAHSHPRIGAFFSSTDRDNQAQWKQPYSLGIVVDPFGRPPLAVFRGPESERLTEVTRSRMAKADAARVAFPVVRVPEAPRAPNVARRPVSPRHHWMAWALAAAILASASGLGVLAREVAAVRARIAELREEHNCASESRNTGAGFTTRIEEEFGMCLSPDDRRAVDNPP